MVDVVHLYYELVIWRRYQTKRDVRSQRLVKAEAGFNGGKFLEVGILLDEVSWETANQCSLILIRYEDVSVGIQLDFQL